MSLSPARTGVRGALAAGGELLGRVADITIGTAIVLWHAAISQRERRRPGPRVRRWSSTR